MSCWLAHYQLSCNMIGQLCVMCGPSKSTSRTVILRNIVIPRDLIINYWLCLKIATYVAIIFNYLFLESVLLNFFVFVLENWPPLYMYLEFWQIVLFSKCESGWCLTIKHKLNREEKLLHHVAVVAKFLDDNKLIKSLKSLFALCQTSPILLNSLIFRWNYFLWDRIYRHLSLEKESDNFCVVFTYSIKPAHSKFGSFMCQW